MICIQSFIKLAQAFKNQWVEGDTQHGDRIRLFLKKEK
jgi:hypothetical protein